MFLSLQYNYQPPQLQDLLDAANETGFPIIKDINDPNTPEGFAIAQAFNELVFLFCFKHFFDRMQNS